MLDPAGQPLPCRLLPPGSRRPRAPRLTLMTLLGIGLYFCYQADAFAKNDVPVAERREQAQQGFAEDLESLAESAAAAGHNALAQQFRDWRLPRFIDKHLILVIPAAANESTASSIDNETDKEQATLLARFVRLREQQANRLFEIAEQAADEEDVQTAHELLYATLRQDPNHAKARAILGYERRDDHWYRPAAIKRLEAGEVWHDRFGWLPEKHVARYEAGERYYRGRWISVAREAEIRSNIKRGWRVETEHFEVVTNHSLDEGVALAKRLEQLHRAWRQLFAAYHTTPAELKKMVRAGKPNSRPSKRHKVVYFRNRDEYIKHLVKRQPGIERSIGIYKTSDRTAYFFAGEDQDPGTVLHEATHQLFQETSSAKRKVAQKANVWIVEGIACYMESLRSGNRSDTDEPTGYDTVGGYNVARLPGARIRLLEDRFYVPFAELLRLGGPLLQRHPQAATIYTQAAGQAAFLMHYDAGHYRGALVDYLRAIYANRARFDTLTRLTERSSQELDQEYRQFLLGAAAASADSDDAAGNE